MNFQNALKNTLRQAPDVILIGEVRDTETMEAAITFAETGHLCIATLHSNNANQAVERIMNFFPVERHAGAAGELSITEHERKLCMALGRRLADIALKLAR